ncbi:MAG: DUF503 domain-containing protein [Anaerolineaceae bacterium]|jgi:uncharacterized protein YlxP (DUF503 family)|nr:DUF503 domain-containing protein [Anaerolineaceae bacterium]
MSSLSIAILTLHLYMPENRSLKQKRGMIKPVLAKLHRDFNLSVSEIDHLNSWKESVLACVIISNDAVHNQQTLQKAVTAIETIFPNITILEENIELL